MAKKKQITVNLFGARGNRSVDITSRGGLFTRHVKIPRKTMMPSIFENTEPKTDTPAPLTQGEAIIDVFRNTEPGWHFDDEILFIATAKTRLKMDHRTLAVVLEGLVADGRIEVKDQGTRKVYRLTPDPVVQRNALKSLLAEVDAILEGGVDNA